MGEGPTPEDIAELRKTTDLSLRATKEMARAIGRSMAALAATERHLWLNLSGIKEKDKSFLLDAPLSPSGLFGDAVNTVVDRFQEARKQSLAVQDPSPSRLYRVVSLSRQQASCTVSTYGVRMRSSRALYSGVPL